MIKDIVFPSDPENYLFMLAPRFASAYLLARARQHYGSLDGIEVACNFFHSEEDILSKRAQYSEICNLAETLGVSKLKFVWYENMFVDPTGIVVGKNKIIRDGDAIVGAYLNIINVLDPSCKPITQEGGFISVQNAAQNLSMLRAANAVNNDMTPNTTTPYKTVAVWQAQTSKSARNKPARFDMYPKIFGEQQDNWKNALPSVDGRSPVWAPLIDYTVTDILTEADKYGVLDQVLSINNCEAHDHAGRPGYCGTCFTCLVRRHSMLQAELTDPTVYG